MKKTFVFLLTLLIIIVIPVLAVAKEINNVKVKGDLTQKVIYDNDDSKFNGLTELDLELSRDFGFEKRIYLNPILKLRYDEDYDFSDLEINEYNGVDYDYFKEAYLDLYLENSDIRIGRQLVNWGTAYKLNPTDLVNPMDITTTDPIETELGVNALKGKYYYNFNTIFTGVLIGEHRATKLPPEIDTMIENIIKKVSHENLITDIYQYTGNMENAESLARTIVNNNFEVSSPVERDIDSLEDAEIAVKAMWRNFYGYDVSLSYFHGYEDLPSIISNLNESRQRLDEVTTEYITEGNSTKTTEIEFGYKETDAIGFNAIGSIKDFGVWSEINFARNEDDEEKIDLVFGGDYTFKNGFYTVAQYFHREYKENQINQFLESQSEDKLLEDQNFLMLHGEMPFKQIHQWQISLIYDLDNNDYMINPELNYSLCNNLSLDLGTVYNDEEDSSSEISLLQMLAKEKSYIQLTYSF